MKSYLQPIDEVLLALSTTEQGLSDAEAQKRLLSDGPNALAQPKKKSLLQRIIDQVKDPMVLILIAAAILSGAFKEIADMVIILAVVALNATLGIIQENKAEAAIEALQKLSAPHTKVIRSGHVKEIASADLVVGDIVLLEAGNAVPADLRLIQAVNLKMEEAALTGESVPVEKTSDTLDHPNEPEIPLGDRVNMAYMGTNVSYGRGAGVVTATGMKTEMGKIATILTNTEEEKTPLQQKLAALSKFLSIAVIAICAFIFVFMVLTSGGFATANVFDSLLTAVSLAVAAIPEGLVVVVTVLLSIGVTKMSKRNAIIRRLTAVETLGCTQVICSDKTGTLTQNRMTVVDHFGPEELLATAMSHCTDVSIAEDGSLMGDPTETALVSYAHSLNITEKLPRVGEAPFDSNRKMMSTIHPGESGYVQYTKGAPDIILSRCTKALMDGTVVPLTEDLRNMILQENHRMAQKALRVLACATANYPSLPEKISADDIEHDLTFVGLVGMIDPIRPEVKDAIETCKTAGIKAIMITGDHRDTAVAIARELGILTDESQAITGSELSLMSDEEFLKRIQDIRVYARVQPEHKVRIVNTWKKIGKISAMTGDGVNDAPAIKSADIGIGMGITGTDVTKNVADVVLSDDNFATIVYAVEEGRRIYENIKKSIQFLLGSNLSEVISIFLATVMGYRLFSPIHILWINLVTDTFPAMALGMEGAEADSMQRPPRDPKETLFADGMAFEVLYQGTIIGVLTLVSFLIGYAQSHIIGMTMAFVTLSMCELFHAMNMRSRTFSLFKIKAQNKFLWGGLLLSFLLTLAVLYIPGVNTIFDLAPLPFYDFFIAMLLAFTIIPVVEIAKIIKRGRKKKAL